MSQNGFGLNSRGSASVKCVSCSFVSSRVWRECGCEGICDHSGFGTCPRCGSKVDRPVNINNSKIVPDSPSILLNIVRPNRLYIGMFLGDLELAIMEKFWDIYPRKMTCRTVHRKLINDDKRWAKTTISCTVKRLAKKGILKRHGPPGKLGGYAHVFSSSCTEDEFIDTSIRYILNSLKESFPEEMNKISHQGI